MTQDVNFDSPWLIDFNFTQNRLRLYKDDKLNLVFCRIQEQKIYTIATYVRIQFLSTAQIDQLLCLNWLWVYVYRDL